MEGEVCEIGEGHQTKSWNTRSKSAAAQQIAKRDVPPEQCRQYLLNLFPGRKDEIEELLSILGEPTDTVPPLLLYGGAATGKTSVIRETMAILRRPFAYVSCRSCHHPRLIFESILNQLTGHVRCKANNYASAKKCERITDFLSQLVEASASACARSSDNKRLDSKFSDTALQVVYLIFDDAELIRGWTGGSALLSSLVTLSSLTRLPNLGLVFVSKSGPDTFQLSASTREPLPIHFRDYTNEDLYSILVKSKPNSELFSFFLKVSLAPFSRTTRILTELSEGLHPLFGKYCESVSHGKVKSEDEQKRELFTYVKRHMRPALSETFFVASSNSSERAVNEYALGGLKSSSSSMAMEFHLSLCSKYLLLASYIASRNPATLDDALFGTGDAVKSRRRKRKSSMSAMEKQDVDMVEKHLKGPGNCSLERLLAIYQCIAGESRSLPDDTNSYFVEEGEGIIKAYGVTADVLMQLATLTSVNLVLRSSSCPLEGLPRFRSNVDADFVHKVARSINFPLSRYLLHG